MSNIIYGFHSISGVLNTNPDQLQRIMIDVKRSDKRQSQLLKLASNLGVKVESVSSEVLNNLSNNVSHQGIIAELKGKINHTLTFKELLDCLRDKPKALILILDGITDPHNLGAIIRSAECFGVDAVILPRDNSANVSNPVVAKVSSAAINYIPVITVTNLVQVINQLQENEFWVAGTSLNDKSISLSDFKYHPRLVWVMGNEGDGIRRLVSDNCDYLVHIPLLGKTESLNVSVAAGIVLAHTRYLEAK